MEPDNKLPYNEYYEYFGPDYTLHVAPGNMENLNAPRDMEKIRSAQTSHLSFLLFRVIFHMLRRVLYHHF